MSECIVEVCRIERVDVHPNADALELAQIKGWQVCVPKGRYAAGDLVTYIPIDSVVPPEHAERWGIAKYLSHGRVRCARLRGEPSFGVVIDREDPGWAEGADVREHYGITKYEPPVRVTAGDAEAPHPLFVAYTEIENLRHFPDVLKEGEPVVVTEKIHGTCCAVACIDGELMAGSRKIRRKRPEGDNFAASTYWHPFSLPGVRAMLESVGDNHRQVILFGEVYGKGVQSLQYGQAGVAFAAFDLLVDGKYLDAAERDALLDCYGIPKVPTLHRGAYSLGTIKALAGGHTTLGADHIREGVVVKPVRERTDPKIGRVALKYIADDYLLSKGISDSRDE